MPPVYQPRVRHPRIFFLLFLLPLACRTGDGDAESPAAPPRAWPLEVHLASRAWELVDVDADGRPLANEWRAGAARAFRGGPDGRFEPLARGETASHRALAALAGDEVLLELAAPAGGAPRLALADGRRAPRPLAATEGARLLGADPEGPRLWLARAGEDGLERLFEVGRSGAARELLEAPPGFRFAAVSGDGTLAAMTRTVAPGADEVVLADRRAGERRLILPTGPDGRFFPLLFSSDGLRLLVATEDASDLARLEWLDLGGGARSPALAAPGCAAAGAREKRGVLVADLACGGVRRAALLLPGALPWEGHLPEGLAVSAALPAGDGSWWLELAGPRAARDLARLGPDRLLAPLTWALAPRLEPGALAVPEVEAAGGARAPFEIWRPPGRAGAAVVWLEDDGAPPRWGEFHPLFSWLASRGLVVVRLRARGSDGFGRALRAAAGEDPLATATADAEAAAERARALAGAGLPVALVAEGERWRALAAPAPRDPFALRLALAARASAAELDAAGRALESLLPAPP